MIAPLHIIVFTIATLYYMKTIFHLCIERVRWWLIGVIAIPVVLYLGFALDSGVHMFLSSNIIDLLGFVHKSLLPCLILLVISDGLIITCMCVLLYRKKTDFKRTRHIINTLIIYAASRGLVTLLVTLVMIIAFTVHPGDMWYSGLEFTLAGLYTNSLMTLLNTRYYSCESTGRSFAGGTSAKSHFDLPNERGRSGLHIENKATNIEFIDLGMHGTNYNESSQQLEEVKSVA